MKAAHKAFIQSTNIVSVDQEMVLFRYTRSHTCEELPPMALGLGREDTVYSELDDTKKEKTFN